MARAYRPRKNRWRRSRRRKWRSYRRRNYTTARRYRRWRRRRHRQKVRVLTEIQPKFQRKCTIRGIFTGLILGQGQATPNFSHNIQEFNPVRRFVSLKNSNNLQTGGWAVGNFSLQALYEEHKNWRNRWSNTNCGFDLVQYHYTTVYLEQHKTMDYIVFFDEEYQSTEEFLKSTSIHPLLMITHPKTILIKSRDRAGPRRARKIHIPRPSWWESGWNFSTDICKKGMFLYYFAFIDLDWPWAVRSTSKEDWNNKDGSAWWKGDAWKKKFDDAVKASFDNSNPDQTDHKLANVGPLIPRAPASNTEPNKQITFFYKSRWTWGGNNLTFKAVCDPCNVLPSGDS